MPHRQEGQEDADQRDGWRVLADYEEDSDGGHDRRAVRRRPAADPCRSLAPVAIGEAAVALGRK